MKRLTLGSFVALVWTASLWASDAIAGGSPYYYFTEYQPDINAALQKLRKAEFAAGRYDPGLSMHEDADLGIEYMFQFDFPPNEESIAPGPSHGSIDEALSAAVPSGTRSILDIKGISAQPLWFHANALTDSVLVQLFETEKPSRELVEAVLLASTTKLEGVNPYTLFWDRIERGTARYIVTYRNGEPDQIFFVGYSFD